MGEKGGVMREVKLLSNLRLEDLERDINGWCCNCDYSIFSFNVVQSVSGITKYVAVIGK